MIINSNDLNAMPQRKRAHFVNCLSGYKSANLIGTISDTGISNLAIISSVFHLGADPALLGFISRPHTVTRDTLENIYAARCYTLNHVNSDIFEQAHKTSARYPAEISEFQQTGLTEEFSSTIKAPYVKESHLKLGLEFLEKTDIKLNNTVLIIGKIIEVILPDKLLGDDGFVDITAINSVCVSGLDRYHSTTDLGRLPYAKP